MKKNGINSELLYTRGTNFAEATHAFTVLALMGHGHHNLTNYGSYLSIGVFDYSEEEQETTIAVVSNILRGPWQLSTNAGTTESGAYWYSEFKYEFE